MRLLRWCAGAMRRGGWLPALLLPLWLGAGEEPEPLVAEPVVTRAVPDVPALKSPPLQPSAPVPLTGTGLGAYSAKYEVRYNGLKVGELTQQLTAQANGRQSMQTVAYTTGLVALLKSDTVTERSIWQLKGERLLPVSYTYRYSGRSDDIFERQDFDWNKREVTLRREGKTTQLALEPQTMDKHMYQAAMRLALRRGVREISVQVVDDARIQSYDFAVLGEEMVAVPHLGKLACLKVKKGTTLIWVAQQLDYLPVKIEKDEDGTSIGTYLIEFQGG